MQVVLGLSMHGIEPKGGSPKGLTGPDGGRTEAVVVGTFARMWARVAKLNEGGKGD